MDISRLVSDFYASRGQVTSLLAGESPWTPVAVHVSPTYFGSDSVVGGGERYAEELSRAMSERTRVRFVSFGKRPTRERVSDRYERVILKSWTEDKMTPFSPHLWRELRGAQAIHCYQLNTLPTFLAAIYAKIQKTPLFVSDLGGGGWTPGYQIDIGRWIRGHLPISKYAARLIPKDHAIADVIYGGVDLQYYPARSEMSHDGSVIFLGRILPHKGIHYLIEGQPKECQLQVIGPVGSEDYLRKLKVIASGKRIEFFHELSDVEIRQRLRRAAMLVHPTPTDESGDAGVNELLGLAVLEAMASNCPVVVSAVASLPELVSHENSGLIVPPNDRGAIRYAILSLIEDSVLWKRLALGGRNAVKKNFLWSSAVDRCLRAYRV